MKLGELYAQRLLAGLFNYCFKSVCFLIGGVNRARIAKVKREGQAQIFDLAAPGAFQ